MANVSKHCRILQGRNWFWKKELRQEQQNKEISM